MNKIMIKIKKTSKTLNANMLNLNINKIIFIVLAAYYFNCSLRLLTRSSFIITDILFSGERFRDYRMKLTENLQTQIMENVISYRRLSRGPIP